MHVDHSIAVAELGTILSVWAHPDDETYLAAGIMSIARDQGQRVVCASATAGERGTDDPATWPPARLGQVRRWEAAAAMAILGVDEHHVLGLPDGGLADCSRAGVAWVDRLIDDVRPDTIVTFGPDGMTYHPDHICVHRWVTSAWQRRMHRPRLLYATNTVERIERFGEMYEQLGIYMTDERPTGVPQRSLALQVRLTDWQLDRKLAALRAMSTQTAGVIHATDPTIFAAEVREEPFLDARTQGRAGPQRNRRSGNANHAVTGSRLSSSTTAGRPVST
ncbi:MAG: PIG-L family deacetylase [Actinobacteria bacterium]|nr:PIG-L family deacetylase [Actinomycetota bacterium]